MTAKKSPPPARLYPILASEASIAVILRRGPSRWVQMIKWHTDIDTFEQGQWFKGRVYENKCDLSPDGKLFIYFVLKGNRVHSDYGHTWTAISKPPYFTALALWKEYGTWGGGGHFIDNRTVRLSVNYGDSHPDHPPRGITVLYNNSDNILDTENLEQLRLAKWELVESGRKLRDETIALRTSINTSDSDVQLDGDDDKNPVSDEETKDQVTLNWIIQLDPPTIWRKTHADLSLEKHYFGYEMHRGDVNQFFVVKNKTSEIFLLSDISWADFDQQGRLVLAKEGKLFSATLQNGDIQLTELADFNANKPDPQPAPDWAQKW